MSTDTLTAEAACPVHPACGCAPASPYPCSCPPLTPYLRERIEADARKPLEERVRELEESLSVALTTLEGIAPFVTGVDMGEPLSHADVQRAAYNVPRSVALLRAALREPVR